MLADAVLPVPPSVDVTGPVTLVLVPRLVPVTLTENVQDAFAARFAPARRMLPLPAIAVMVPLPHEPVRPFGVETTRPDGNVSVKPTPPILLDLGL